MKFSFVLLIVLGMLLCGCALPGGSSDIPKPDFESFTPVPGMIEHNSAAVSGIPLICSADSEEEAMELAGLYGIELVSFHDGIAGFYTEENPKDVIARGEENGWPKLSLNHIQHAMTE